MFLTVKANYSKKINKMYFFWEHVVVDEFGHRSDEIRHRTADEIGWVGSDEFRRNQGVSYCCDLYFGTWILFT